MNSFHEITLLVHRFDPEQGRKWKQTYALKAGATMRLTDVFRKINQEQDPSLAWSSSCEHAQCGSCGVIINGRPILACETLIGRAVEHFNTSTFEIRPLTCAPVVRDLIVDFEKAYEKVERAKPYIIKPASAPEAGKPYQVELDRLASFQQATRCVNCFCCVSACISSSRDFLGPNALMACMVRLMDPREAEVDERMEILKGDDGLPRCHSSRACSHVCPKEIDVAHFLALAKAADFAKDF